MILGIFCPFSGFIAIFKLAILDKTEKIYSTIDFQISTF